MTYRTSDYAIENTFNLLRILLGFEQGIAITELANVAQLSFKTTQKYIGVLEKLGLVKIEPQERKNLVRLTEKGRCLAKCLVSKPL